MANAGHWIRSSGVGVASALSCALLLTSILMLFDPTSKPQWAIPRAALLALRLSVYLVIAGAVLGAVFLRSWPLRWRRLVLLGTLSLLVAVACAVGLQSYRYQRWKQRVMNVEILPGTHESELVSRLGRPSKIIVRAIGPNEIWNSDCSGGTAVKQLEYIPPGGGIYRTFYIDKTGHVVCEGIGALHLWI